jgi:hypothetical protein
MRIERGQHAVDRGFDELLVRDALDIVGAHPLEHLAEQVELPVGLRGLVLRDAHRRGEHETAGRAGQHQGDRGRDREATCQH